MERFFRYGKHHLLDVKHIANPLARAKVDVTPAPKNYKFIIKQREGENAANGVLKTIYFIRHGQSESNIAREAADPEVNTHPRFTDAKLTERGIRQASALQDIVSTWDVQLVVVSPLTRALQTACHAFHKTSVPMRADPLVTEYYSHLIECKGREKPEILKEERLRQLRRFSDVCFERVHPQWWLDCDNVERPSRFLDKAATFPEERLCVVSHFGTINMFTLHEPSRTDLNIFLFPFPHLQNCDALETTWLLEA